MRVLIALISMYLMGYLLFTVLARFDESQAWGDGYFIWMSLFHGGVFAWGAIYHFVPVQLKKLVRWPLYLSLVLFVWEIVSVSTGININNQVFVSVMYFMVLSVTTYMVIREIINFNK